MAKVLCVLYDDPENGYPPEYPRDEIPKIDSYPDGQTTPTPDAIDFTPGELLGCVSGELGLRKFLEDAGHELVVTSDKEGEDSEFEQHLSDAEIVISQPFWPAYLTAERIAKAPNLKMAVTAGIGSDHVDLQAAIERKITVAEVTYCNSISVSEHVVMMILGLVRNYMPSYKTVIDGGWNIADCASREYDLEGMQVGTVAAGRIGYAVLKRLAPFDVGLHYTDRHRLPKEAEAELGLTFHETAEDMVGDCDVVTINAPLHPETENLFDEKMLGRMKRGAYIVNTARGKIVDRDAIVAALEIGTARGLRRRRLVPAAALGGAPVAVDAPPRDDPAHLGHQPLGAGALRGGHAGDPRVLLRRQADPRRVPDRPGRRAGRDRRSLLQRGRRDRRLRRGLEAEGVGTGTLPADGEPGHLVEGGSAGRRGGAVRVARRRCCEARVSEELPVGRRDRRVPDRGRTGEGAERELGLVAVDARRRQHRRGDRDR